MELQKKANHSFRANPRAPCMGSAKIGVIHPWCDNSCGYCKEPRCDSYKEHPSFVNPIASTSPITPSPGLIQTFATGATRSGGNKPDYSGYLSPYAIRRYGEYMLKHQTQVDGSLRSSSNWKLGIPLGSFKESLIRHVIDLWAAYEARAFKEVEELACAVLFNAQGLLHELLKKKVKEDLPF